MKTRMWTGVAAVALVGIVATAAWAAPQAAGPAAQENRPLLKCLMENIGRFHALRKDMNLTPEQRGKVAEILKSHKTEIAAALRNLHADHQKLLDAVRAEPVSEAAVRAAAAKMGDSIAAGSILRAKVRGEIMAVLDPSQRKQVDQFLGQVRGSVDQAIAEFEAK